MNNPLISVNITTYNRANLLPKALDSILAQTYKNLEVIIVDDCSTDNTTEIVNYYKQKDTRIRYIRHEKNKKLARSRNTAWQASKGKYIAFMDDDDEWIDREKLEKQVNFFENHENKKVAIVCSSVRLYKNNNVSEDKIIHKPKDLKSAILSGNGIMYTPTVMMRNDVIDVVGGFDENMPRGIDGELYRRCIIKYDYDVFFMPDLTTAVREYGNDRITPVKDKDAIQKVIYANFYLIKKYFWYYLLRPFLFFKRFKVILLHLYKIFQIKFY